MVKKVSELKSSKNKDQRITYNLLAHMLKKLYCDLSSSLEDKELAHLLGISKPQVARLRQSVNMLLEAEVLFHKPLWRIAGQFNPKYYLGLRAAFKECGEELPPLNFEQLLSLALDDAAAKPKWDLDRWDWSPRLEVPEYLRRDGVMVEGAIYVATRDQWTSRPSGWKGFEDMAPANIIVFVHEENPQGLFIEAIASKTNNQVEAIVTSLLKLNGVDGLNIQVKKLVLEPTGQIRNQIKRVLTDQNIRQKGYVSEISYALKLGYYSVGSSSSPERDEVLGILKAEGLLREMKEDVWTGYFLPFVKLCYTQNFSEEERRIYENEGLSDEAKIISYRTLGKDHYEIALPLPYPISSNPLFPFHEGEMVKISIQGKTLLIMSVDGKSAGKATEKT